jgi:hypothetical protein
MASSKPVNAIIKANGKRPRIKYTKPKVMILYVKPLKIVRSKWPLNRSTNLSSYYVKKYI